jgi:hypothetical protein
MYKKYKILIYFILFILVLSIINYLLKNNNKLEKYSPQDNIIQTIDKLNEDINNIVDKHNINESTLEDIIYKIVQIKTKINKQIEELEKNIGKKNNYKELLEKIRNLLKNINNLQKTINEQNIEKVNNKKKIQELQNLINNLQEKQEFLIRYKRYDGETIESFSDKSIVLLNYDGETINNDDRFNLNNPIKIKIGSKYLKKSNNSYYVKQGLSPTSTKIQSTEKLPNIPGINWLNIMGYQKVKEITTGNTLSNPNGESICAFAVWPRWGTSWSNTNENNLPTRITLRDSNGTDLFSKTIVNYWKEIFVSNAETEDRCQVFFLPSISTSTEFIIVHDKSISRCAILKNNNGNNNCNSLSISFGRQCTRERPNGAFNVNGQTQRYTGLTNPRTFNFILTERLYHFGGSFTNDRFYYYYVWRRRYRKRWRRYSYWRKYCRGRRWRRRRRCRRRRRYYWAKRWRWERYKHYYKCDSNVRILSMDLPGYNLFNNRVTSRKQTLINQTKLHWRLSPNRDSIQTPVFAWRSFQYYYKILNYNNTLRTLAEDYINYLNNIRTELINSTYNSEFLNYNQSSGLIEYRIKKSLYNQYNFNLTEDLNNATSFILECHNDTGTNLCDIEPEILRMGRKYKIKTSSEGTYVKDLDNILNDIDEQPITIYPDNDIINNIDSDPYILQI